MFTSKLFMLLLLVFPLLAIAQQDNNTFMVCTYNIKYDNTKDTVNNWKNRREVVANLLKFNKIDILGVQEALHNQMTDLDSLLPDHSYVGVGRDDGAEAGEYSAIFYNRNLFEVLESNTFWLSKTPEKPSKSWDAALPRICTWAVLKDKNSNAVIFVFNTHFDHIGEKARVNSAKLILEKIKAIAKNNPVVLMGDFNSEPSSEAYAILTKSNLADALKISETTPFGPKATFNDFDFFKVPEKRIDYIFPNKYFEVKRHGVLNNHYGLKYPSDHFPVVAEMKFTVD